MKTQDLLRDALRQAHIYLELKLDLCPEHVMFEAPPGSTIASIAAIYAHIVLTEDAFMHRQLRGAAPPLYESAEWISRVTFPPKVAQDRGWTAAFRTDMNAFRQYAQAVFAAGESAFTALTDEDLARPLLSHFVHVKDGRPLVERREVALGLLFSDNVIMHTCEHTGEISALLGRRGLQGSHWG